MNINDLDFVKDNKLSKFGAEEIFQMNSTSCQLKHTLIWQSELLDCEIKRRLRLRRAAMEELGKIIKSKDVSLEPEAKIIYTSVIPSTTTGAKVGQ